jgi:hypothetical protein
MKHLIVRHYKTQNEDTNFQLTRQPRSRKTRVMSWRIYFLFFLVVCRLEDLSCVMVVFVGEVFRTVGIDG